MRYFAIAYALAIGAAFLPLEPVWLKWIVAVLLIVIYGWYVKGHFEADASVDLEDLAPLRFHRLDVGAHREEPTTPRLRVVNVQVIAALGLIILGCRVLRELRRTHRDPVRHRQHAPRAGHRPDRHRAAREVQLDHLGPPGQGHPGDGQHHRGDGLPVVHPDGRRAPLRLERLVRRRGLVRRLRVGRASPSCRRR